jgi:hypothetical protein
MPAKSTRSKMALMQQVCELIPPQMVPKLAREFGVDARKFSAWSHTTAHIYGQLTHAVGLNDICDGLDLNSSALRSVRGATPPKRNTFSHANRTRDSRMAEALYWRMLDHLTTTQPSFGRGKTRSRYLRRFKAAIHAVDSTTIELVANSMDWAKHRRRKAAAKCHLNLNLQSMLPRCAIVDTAKFHDSRKAWDVCAGLREGEIVVFDKAYLDFVHLNDLDERGVQWVSRAKDNMQHRTVQKLNTTAHGSVLRDEIIELTGDQTQHHYEGKILRLVEAIVEVDGKETVMTFITNNLDWSAWTIAELYRARWEIEVFFKELKQTVQLVDFVGHNKNAVQWQIWMALLTHLLVRFLAHLSRWGHTFTRLFTLLRAALWHRFHVVEFLTSYGTAGGSFRMLACPQQAYLPGFGAPEDFAVGQPRVRRTPQRKRYGEIMQGTKRKTRQNARK